MNAKKGHVFNMLKSRRRPKWIYKMVSEIREGKKQKKIFGNDNGSHTQ